MSELYRAANPTIEEAIKYLEGMIFTQDFHPSTLRAKAVNTMAIEALREQGERSRGCVWCNENNKVFHDGQHFHLFCSYCGKRLEVEQDG
jgi:hypothetical protein